jgi:hypothetical protein
MNVDDNSVKVVCWRNAVIADDIMIAVLVIATDIVTIGMIITDTILPSKFQCTRRI